MKMDLEMAEALVYGGTILGGGGGGSREEGLTSARLALELGLPTLLPLSDTDPAGLIVTVSSVGAPAARERYVKPMDYVRAVSMIEEAVGRSIDGLIQNEMGGFASGNGLIQSAVLGIPLIDAPCNGRAHPLGLMGGLGLHKNTDYHAVQTACGGDPEKGRRIELLVEGTLFRCSAMVRQASIQAGGIVAVARNPIRADWLKDRAALGAMEDAIELGRIFLKALDRGHSPEEEIAGHLKGDVVARGKVTTLELTTEGGFDVGRMVVDGRHELIFMNEYMLLETDGERRYTFPDLIVTLDARTHQVLNTAEMAADMDVVVVATGMEHLILGAGMRDRDLLHRVEEAIHRPLIS